MDLSDLLIGHVIFADFLAATTERRSRNSGSADGRGRGSFSVQNEKIEPKNHLQTNVTTTYRSV